jgi:type I restriction enzyme S subunit
MNTDWKSYRFGDVTRVASGLVDPREEPYCDYLHVGPENIETDSGNLNNLRTAAELNLISGKYLFDEHAIVYSKIRPNLNKVCYPGFIGICSADAYAIWAREELVDREYLLQVMRSPLFVEQAVAVSMRTGMPKINQIDLSRLTLPLPTINEQKAIAAVLSTWDRGIRQLTDLIAAKLRFKQGLMQQLLTGKRRFKEYGEPAGAEDELPEEWRRIKAGKLFGNHSLKKNDGEELLSVTQDRGVIPRQMLEGRVAMPESGTGGYKLVEPGDFVISLRSFQGGLEYSQYRGLVSPAYTVLKPRREIDDAFFRHYFKSYDFIQRLAVAVIGIRDGKQISYGDFEFVKLPYPPVKEQQRIAKVLDVADHEIHLLRKQLEALKQQKKGLMQKLLTGEVRVKLPKGVT